MDGWREEEEEKRKVEVFWAWEFFVLSERRLAYPAAAIASTASLFAFTGPRRSPGADSEQDGKVAIRVPSTQQRLLHNIVPLTASFCGLAFCPPENWLSLHNFRLEKARHPRVFPVHREVFLATSAC